MTTKGNTWALLLGQLGLAALVWLHGGSASAEDAGVIAVGGSPEVVADDWDTAVNAAAEELQRGGYRVTPEHVRRRGMSPEDCTDAICLETQREALGVSTLAVVIVWGGTTVHDRAAHVVVSLVTSESSFESTIEVESGDVAVAARRAVIAARESMARGGRPWLRVHGSPVGAMVVIDGVETGVLPWEGEVSAGTHSVEVRLGGYVAARQSVDVSSAPGDVEVALVPTGGGGPDLAWVIVGSASAAGGVAAIVAAVIGATTHSCAAGCMNGAPATSVTVPDDGAVIGWAVTGGVLVVLGAVGLGVGLSAGGASSSSPVTLGPGGLSVAF